MIKTFSDAITRACEESTLVDALSWIALWECERVIPVAHKHMPGNEKLGSYERGWDTCFNYLFKEVMEEYSVKRLKGK
jgi:hypothetical protein